MLQDSINNIQNGLEQGIVTPQELESLQKAIAAGYGGAGKPTDLTYGGVIQSESLETTLKSVTFDMKNLKMWPAISIDKAYNLFEQYNRITAYGSDASPYIGEGGAPQEEDSTYVRDGQKIVFFGTRRKVTHQMTLVRTTIGDVVAQQAKEGTMHLLKNVERELYWGNAHYINAVDGSNSGATADLPADSIAMNGLLQQIKKGDTDEQMISGDFAGYGAFESVVRDLAGGVLSQDDVEELSVILLENFGNPDQIHLEPAVLSQFVKQFYPQFRSAPGLANQTVGYDVSKIQTTAGSMDLKPNLFLRPRSKARPQGVNRNAPSVSGLTLAGAAGGTGGSLEAGDYNYKMTLVNDFGESAPIQAGSAVSVAAGEKVTMTITGALPAGVKSVRLYRSAVGGAVGSEEFVGNYKVSATYVDAGAKLPGLGEAFMLDMKAECMRFKQLAPLSKLNFAIVTTAVEFGIVLYGALFVYTPRFIGCWENMGK